MAEGNNDGRSRVLCVVDVPKLYGKLAFLKQWEMIWETLKKKREREKLRKFQWINLD